jgi:hypothetical protein
MVGSAAALALSVAVIVLLLCFEIKKRPEVTRDAGPLCEVCHAVKQMSLNSWQ